MQNVVNKIRVSKDRTYGDVIRVVLDTFNRDEVFGKSRPYWIIWGELNRNVNNVRRQVSIDIIFFDNILKFRYEKD